MLALLLTTSLALASSHPEEPLKTDGYARRALPEKTAKPAKKRTTVAVPTEPVPDAAVKPQSQPKPVVHPKPGGDEARKLAEAEARAARLAHENARLQEALARKDVAAPQEIQSPEAALTELREGNQRFTEGRRVRTLLSSGDAQLRQSLAKGQSPFAVVVTCSDSRLMDNLIFDQELGRLFTIREAGNCPDTQGVASVEYAVEHLGSKIVVVLGHTSCGAVKAVAEAHGTPLPGNLWSFQAAMAGLLETTPEDPNLSAADHLRHLEKNNAIRQARVVLDRSEIVRHLVSAGKLKVIPAIYDLATGSVTFLDVPADPKPAAHH